MNIHAIVGNGTAPEKVINEGLRDVIKADDAVGIVWSGPPNDTEEAIFGYILDNDVTFILYYEDGDKLPKAFREADHGVCQKSRTPAVAAIKAVEGKGKVLFLWDDEADDDQVDVVFNNVDKGTLVLELTNGLAPIALNEDIPEPTDPDIAEDEDTAVAQEDTRFTKLELESMTAAAVKRYGERLKTESVTKKGIIEELFPDGETPVPESEEEAEDAPETTNTGSIASVDLTEVPSLLRIISGNLLRLANALDS